MSDIDKLVDSINDLVSEMKGSSPAANSQQNREDSIKLGEERREQLLAEIRLEEDLEKRISKKIERIQNEIELNKLSSDSVDDKAKKQKKLEKDLERLTEKQKGLTEATQDYSSAVESVSGNIAGFLGMSRSYERTLIGQLAAIKDNTEAQKDFGEELQKIFSPKNVGISLGAKAIELAIAGIVSAWSEMEAGTTAFNQATGMADMYHETLKYGATGLNKYNVYNEDIANSLTALAGAIPLRELGDSHKMVAQNIAIYSKFGVSADTSAQTFASLTKSFEMNSHQAIETQEQIFALGRELGVGAPKMAESFKEALPRLGIYGNQAVKVFRKVASSSAQLGLEAGDILDLAESFQTFEGSAQAAGKLNAILGGGFIDNLELMETSFESPADAALMIRDAFKQADKSVADMGPAAIKAAAAAANITDVDKFRRFLQGDIDTSKLLEDTTQKLAIDTKNISKDSQTVLQEILNQIKNELLPIFTKFINPVMKMLKEWLKKDGITAGDVVGGAVGATGAYMAGSSAITTGGAVLAAEGGMMAAASAGLASFAAAVPAVAGLGAAARGATNLFTAKTMKEQIEAAEHVKHLLLGLSTGAALSTILAPAMAIAGVATAGATATTLVGSGVAAVGLHDVMSTDSKMPENKAAQQDRADLRDNTKSNNRLAETNEKLVNKKSVLEVRNHGGAEKFVSTVMVDKMNENVPNRD